MNVIKINQFIDQFNDIFWQFQKEWLSSYATILFLIIIIIIIILAQ